MPGFPSLRFLPVLALALAACAAEPSWGPGQVAPDPPRQEAPADEASWAAGDYQLTPRATFHARARLLSVRHYRSDREADLASTDVAMGWGVMSDERVLGQLRVSQSGRWYHYRWEGSPPANPVDMARSSTNVHLIPSSPALARDIARLRAGDVVVLSGRLVDARAPDGWRWHTSLTRHDTGGGACELLWVERLAVEPAPVD